MTSVTDANGGVTSYTYGNAAAMHALTELASSGTGTVNYTYDQNARLSVISRGATGYYFTYDTWGNVSDTKVGTVTLSTNTYDQYGRLHYVTYGNGFVTEYIYDDLDRVSEIKQGRANALVTKYCFIYNGEGDLYELRNYDTHRSAFFEYDHAGRCMASTEKSFKGSYGSAITYTGTVSGYKYEYDANNNLTKLTCRLANGTQQTSWTTTYSYDGDNRPTTALLDNGKSIVNTYDAIGRLSSRKLKNGNTLILETALTYVAGANGSKTALVSSYQNGSDAAYNYTYDANGNITAITKGSVSFTYTYDAANQLIRENLYYGSGNSNNATYTYEYDAWGNIQSKKKYAYTTGTLGTVQNTVTYGYSNTQWGDLLTSFNGSTITYDAMGNPTSYLGKTLSWEGKRLVSYTNGSTSITYAYNEDGLRLSKTVDGTVTEYYYNGSVLIGMKIGTGSSAKVLRFSYDASGNVVAVDYSSNNGSSFATYYYLRNAQNDIVKIVDNSGASKVEYTYDSWGKIISATGTLTATLGTDQPFRYRGYVYDEETQWYYLQSRYYDPATCRFISADVLLSTGQGVIGHNSFAYCNNNPVALTDEGGCVPSYNVMMADDGKSSWLFVYYDVPIYGQGYGLNLCWAFCQVMIESYKSGVVLDDNAARDRAIVIAKEKHRSNDEKKWKAGEWPQNMDPVAINFKNTGIHFLYELLKNYGPIYAYYHSRNEETAHLVIVTGVDVTNNIIYTNNPWGIKGKQSFDDFLNGFAIYDGKTNTDYFLAELYYIK